MDDTGLNIFNAILILSISTIPAFLALKTSGNIRVLLIALMFFTLVHGIYHLTDALGLGVLADSVFRPISVAILIIFGLIAYKITRKKGGQ
jgi:DMSO/TMAO reductase YedYZ heme-binding membrane subunit